MPLPSKLGFFRPGGRLRSFEAAVVGAGLLALVAVGPLRDVLEPLASVRFLGALVLFLVPGVLVWRWFFRERFAGAAAVPASFAVSVGLFAALGVPMLVLHRSLEEYLWVAGAVVGGFLISAALRAALYAGEPPTDGDAGRSSPNILWAPFVALGGILAFVSRTSEVFDGDTGNYLSWVRQFLSTDKLALYEPYFGNRIPEVSRVKINGWFLEQAALSRLSGIDPVEMLLGYLRPTLVVVGLLAFYALARTLLKSEPAALLIACLYAVFLLVHLSTSPQTFGGEFVGRITQDKFLTRFLFLPVILVSAVAFLESRGLRYLALFAFLCWAVIAVHPVGLAVAGLSMAGFALAYLGVNWRRLGSWAKMAGLGAAGASAVAVPGAVISLFTRYSLSALLKSADIADTDPAVLANMVFVRPEWDAIYELGDGTYIMDPGLILNPVILAGYLLGIPFLSWRLRHSLGAQLLLGTMVLVGGMVYVPPIATFLGDHVVLPGQIYRLAWPIPLAALLTLGWIIWEAVRYAQGRMNSLTITRSVAGLLPLMVVAAVMAVAIPRTTDRVEDICDLQGFPPDCSLRLDPVFRWMQDNVDEPSVVLAPDWENTFIPAYSADLNVVSLRGRPVISNLPGLRQHAGREISVPQSAWDVHYFYNDFISREQRVEILRRYRVDYVLTPANAPLLGDQLDSVPGLKRLQTPGQDHVLYSVDRQDLPRYLPGEDQKRVQAGAYPHDPLPTSKITTAPFSKDSR